MSGTGNYGLKAIEWGGARKALLRLGATENGVTSGHLRQRLRLPSGTVIEMGEATNPRQRAHRGEIGRLLQSVEAEGLQPLIFVAALDAAGGAVWLRRGAEVDAMRKFLRHWPGKTTDRASWTAIWQAYCERGLDEQPEPEPEPVEEPKPEQRWFTVAEVTELAGTPTKVAADRLRHALKAPRPRYPFAALIDAGEVADIPKPPGLKARYPTVLGLSEHAAEIAADWLADTARGEPQADEELPAPEKLQEAPHEEPEAPAAAVVAEEQAEPLAERAPASSPWPEVGDGPAWALVSLCRRYGATWVFDGYAIDVDATLLRLKAVFDREDWQP